MHALVGGSPRGAAARLDYFASDVEVVFTFWHAARRACPIADASSALAEIRNQRLPPPDTVSAMLPSSTVDASTVMGFLVCRSYDLVSASVNMIFIAGPPCISPAIHSDMLCH